MLTDTTLNYIILYLPRNYAKVLFFQEVYIGDIYQLKMAIIIYQKIDKMYLISVSHNTFEFLSIIIAIDGA